MLRSLLRPLLWLWRFPHRRGYGIQSPFAFSFVTGVIYRPGRYYADQLLPRLHAAAPRPRPRLKDCRLLFRLANFVQPRLTLLDGLAPHGLEARCIRWGCQTTRRTTVPQPADLIVCGEGWPDRAMRLLPLLREGGLMVLTDIGSSRERRSLWRQLCRRPEAVVTFDLWHYGLILNRPELRRQDYVVNYY